MSQSRVASRYAAALFHEAQHHNSLDSLVEEMRLLGSMLRDSRDLAVFFASPVIKASQKSIAIKTLAEKSQFSTTLKNFLLLLVEKSRENEISNIIEAFEALYNQHKSLLPIEVVSAMELDKEQKEKLLQSIEQRTGKKPVATYKINAALIGGFTVKIGDMMMDSSVKHQLEVLKKRLQQGAFSN
jgi:F-type H+-transporting ATPase subunit delta